LLQFGPWSLGACGEGYAYGAHIGGEGTSRVHIERLSENEFRLTAPPGSMARLWDYVDPKSPVDLGLYSFSFAAVLTGIR
jgi:hypothetical protein